MFRILKSKKDEVPSVSSPVTGTVLPIADVPDEVFSSKAMGDGFAVLPEDNQIAAPADGQIVLIAQTRHAFGLKTKQGVEILVHVGLDTVDLNGKGFKVCQKEGTTVKAGQVILEYDPAVMKKANKNMTTMVIFTSGYNKPVKLETEGCPVRMGQMLMQMG